MSRAERLAHALDRLDRLEGERAAAVRLLRRAVDRAALLTWGLTSGKARDLAERSTEKYFRATREIAEVRAEISAIASEDSEEG